MFTQYYGIWDQDTSAAPFHPTQISSAVAIWEADVTVEDSGGAFPIDGEEVYSWIDQTSNAYSADRVTSGPLYETTTGVNSAESLLWDAGNNDVLAVTGSDSSPLLSATGDWHIIAVCNYNTADSSTTTFFSQGDTNTANNGHIYLFQRQIGTTLRSQLRLESDGTYADLAVTAVDVSSYTGTDYILEVKRSGATFTTIIDGNTQSGTTNAAHSIHQDGFTIGGQGAPWGTTYSARWQGALAAFYVFNSVLTGTDYTNMTSYISSKYGV